ncbi:TVP38/TMEM64 family protein [Halobacteriaceae archaeon GCM10025711]
MSVSRRRVAGWLALATLVAAGLVLSPDEMFARLHGVLASPWFPAVLVGLYLLRPLLAWPITLLSVLVGYQYGFAVGVPLALAGAVATSLIPYAVARRVRSDAGLVGRATAGSERFFDATGDFRGVVAARLVPTPAEAISAAAGVAGVSLPAFVVGTAVGELPWTVAAVAAGSSMETFAPAVVEVVDSRLVLVGGVVAVVLLARPVYRYVSDRRQPVSE